MNENITNTSREMPFLDHLEELRWHLLRSVIVIVCFSVGYFIFKSFLFDQIIFGPKSLFFPTYKLLCFLENKIHFLKGFCLENIAFTVTNIEMTGQFLIHIKASVIMGFVTAFPYIFWEIWRFIKPGLRKTEKKYTGGIVVFSSLFFLFGVAFGYYVIAPFSLNFLGSYQVSENVQNTINLSSYVNTLSMLVLATGVIFELPMAVYILSKIGLLSPDMMRDYRRHSYVVILVLSASITPPDVISQFLIGVPLLILYEMSIFISKRVYKEV